MKTALTLAALLFAGCLCAQQPDFLITTGTTNADGAGNHWAYLVWDSTQSNTTAGKSFAIYAKSGQPADPGSYTRQTVITPVVSAEFFAPLLQRASTGLDDELPVLDVMLDDLVFHLDMAANPGAYRLDRPGNPQPPYPAPSISPSEPIAKKLELVLKKASQHPTTLQGINGLKARHPSIALCLGQGWTGTMPAQVMTYEVRQFDVAAGSDIAVVGRVTLDWAVPPALVSPGKPVWVPNDKAEGDLNIRLRWAVPDALRRLGPQVQGYNLYRTTWQHARSDMNWHTTAPSLSQLHADGQTQLVSKDIFQLSDHQPNTKIVPGLASLPQLPNVVSRSMPVFTNKFFSDADVDDLMADGSTFFFADDNRRYETMQPGAPFEDQAEYGYIVVPRDLLGREGPPSLAGIGIACRTMPPDVPGFVKAASEFNYNAGVSTQKIVVTWKANTNAGSDARTNRYEILRARRIADFRSENGKPNPATILATGITHTADGIEMRYEDTTVEADFDAGETIAYAVRAVRDPAGPSGPFNSDPSPPAFGTLRNYKGPAAPNGTVMQHCVAPFVAQPEDEPLGNAPADGLRHFRISCERKDRQISTVTFFVVDQTNAVAVEAASLLNVTFPSNEDVVSYEFAYPHGNISVTATVSGADGSLSWPYIWDLNPYATNYATTIFHGTFRAKTIDPCSKRRGDLIAVASYGRVIKPASASAVPTSPTVSVVTLTPNAGYQFSPNALVNVARVSGSGVPVYLTSVIASSGASISFSDTGVNGLTPQQLLARYRLYTFDKSENIGVGEIADPPFADTGGKRLVLPANAALPADTQVCITRRDNGRIVGPATVNANGEIIIVDKSFGNANAPYSADVFLGPALAGTCKHIPVTSAPDGTLTTVPVQLIVGFAPGSVEYRLYRRVDDGPLSLIAQGDNEFSNDQIKDIIRTDDSMPAVNCVLRYYAQSLDKNGNPSPLVLLDTIKLGVGQSTPLPTPMMLEPKLTVNGSVSTLNLKWFCPTAGVDRFRVYIKSTKAPPDGGLDIDQGFEVTDPATGSKVKIYGVYAYLTKRVGSPGFTGPSFPFAVDVAPDAEYYASVEALAPEKFDNEGFDKTPHGEPSLFVKQSVPPVPVAIPSTSVVPWPARPLPGTESGTDIHTEALELGAYPRPTTLLSDKLYFTEGSQRSTIGVRIGSWFANRQGQILGNPNAVLLSIPAHDDRPTIKSLPAVLYRQQVRRDTNGAMLPTSQQGPVVQCSPLLTQIAYHVNGTGEITEGWSVIKDPAVGFKLTDYQPGIDLIDFYLMDKLPVTKGASYLYWLVHFSELNEPDRVIYTGEVAIPTTP
jgi:hypothetical protein